MVEVGAMKTTVAGLLAVLLLAPVGCGDEEGTGDLGNLVDHIYVTGMSVDDDFFETGSFELSLRPMSGSSPADAEELRLRARAAYVPPRRYPLTQEGTETGTAEFPLFGDPPGLDQQGEEAWAQSDTCAEGTDLSVSPVEKVAPRSASTPLAIDIHIDSSGSMKRTDSDRLRVDAANNFVDLMVRFYPGTQFAVTDFGAGGTPPFQATRLLADFTDDVRAIRAATEQVVADGGTPLFASTLEVLEILFAGRASNRWERAMVVLSDGQPSDDELALEVYERARSLNIPLNGVALTEGQHNRVMRLLAEETEGIYTSASDADDLSQAFEAVALGNKHGYQKYTLRFPMEALPNGPTEVCVRYGQETEQVVTVDPFQAL